MSDGSNGIGSTSDGQAVQLGFGEQAFSDCPHSWRIQRSYDQFQLARAVLVCDLCGLTGKLHRQQTSLGIGRDKRRRD